MFRIWKVEDRRLDSAFAAIQYPRLGFVAQYRYLANAAVSLESLQAEIHQQMRLLALS
jgi:hypothetical protein